MTWTPERIEAVESALTFAEGCTPAYAEVRITGDDFREIVALARIGLAVVKAEPETVERVARAINDTRLPWQSDMLDTDALCVRATAALAALREMATSKTSSG